MTIQEIIDALTEYYKSQDYRDVYETKLKEMSDGELVALYKQIFAKPKGASEEELLMMGYFGNNEPVKVENNTVNDDNVGKNFDESR